MGRKKAAISGQLADVDLRLLRVFRSVVESGGFTAAEIQLNLANSTISNYISDLEKRLDMRLCDRGRGGFALTDQGKEVYEATLELLSAVDQFRNRVNRSHNRIFGHLHLGFAEHMLGAHHSCIVAALNNFSQQAPDVRVQITTMSSDEICTAVLEKKVDIGVTVLPHSFPELNTLTLFEEEMRLYCGPDHPLFDLPDEAISEEDLLQYKFVESPRLMPGREVLPEMRAWNKHAKAHHQEARATLILSGHYLGFLPKHLVENWGMANNMRPLLTRQFGYSNSFDAIWRKKHSNEQVITTFTQCLHKSLLTS
jgi:DNA-binding transcriptional LysR family regulator